jgi:7,8-dihydropterin-6-yl-methyl-4-(beta-D-ribofuranosyl)aminobenzene 5'-phosphate synthase
MKLTVLVDNNTLIDRYFLAEPGLSFYIEDNGTSILFDCGYSGIFLQNALKLHIDLMKLDYLVFSHNHLDHTWGLESLIKAYAEARIEGYHAKTPVLVSHPKTFHSTLLQGIGEIGSLITTDRLSSYLSPHFTREPFALTDRLFFLGEIPRVTAFENREAIGRKAGEQSDDTLPDDSALVYKGDDGLVIITGCSHAGICNIVEHAKSICDEERVIDIIGGLHLLQPSEHQLQGTLKYVKALNLQNLHACHCTDLPSKVALASVAPVREVGVGLSITYQ